MKKTFLLGSFLMILFAVAVAAEYDDDCYAKCKLGAYGDCLAQGGDEAKCYEAAFMPCVKQCPVRADVDVAEPVTAIARPISIKPMPAERDCEAGCRNEYESCMASGGDPSKCKDGFGQCVSQACGYPQREPVCPKPSEETGCEVRCSHQYYDCARKAASVADPAQQKDILYHCRESVGDCLDNCRPGMITIKDIKPEPMPAEGTGAPADEVKGKEERETPEDAPEKDEAAPEEKKEAPETEGFWVKVKRFFQAG